MLVRSPILHHLFALYILLPILYFTRITSTLCVSTRIRVHTVHDTHLPCRLHHTQVIYTQQSSPIDPLRDILTGPSHSE